MRLQFKVGVNISITAHFSHTYVFKDENNNLSWLSGFSAVWQGDGGLFYLSVFVFF